MRVIVVGAGLTCAKVLLERGAEVAVFAASDGVGGRVRTDDKDGFLLDRGMQVYFTSYPVSRRHLDHAKLDFRTFDPGEIIHHDDEKRVLYERCMNLFFKPFYGGIFLSRALYTASRVFRFILRMLATGRTVIPAYGMGEIPKQLASHLPQGVLWLNRPAASRLTGEATPEDRVGEICLYYETSGLWTGKKILLNAGEKAAGEVLR